jgi:hypothetical protein
MLIFIYIYILKKYFNIFLIKKYFYKSNLHHSYFFIVYVFYLIEFSHKNKIIYTSASSKGTLQFL